MTFWIFIYDFFNFIKQLLPILIKLFKKTEKTTLKNEINIFKK